MFAPIDRRLALVNALVIAMIVIMIGALALGVLRYRIDQQAQDALGERAMTAAAEWAPALAANHLLPFAPLATSTASPAGNDTEASSSNELIESGDTFLLAFNRDGALVANPRGLNPDSLPRPDDVALAIAGKSSATHVQLSDGETAQIYTMPVRSNNEIVGAVQAIQGGSEHDQTVQLMGIVVAACAGLGILLAAPAGLFLARRAMRPIDRAFARQQAFVADAAHELRTPLTVLRANVEMIDCLPEITGKELKAELNSMIVDIDDMSRLVSDLLDLARADAGQLVVSKTRADLSAVVRETVDAMQTLAQNAELSLRCEPSPPVVVAVDPTRIRQLVRALVDNAISYTPKGGSVRVCVARQDRSVVIEVRDTGIGIPAAEHENIFRRFYRTDPARARSAGGTGLGLSIAQAIAIAHDGTISLASSPGEGALVRVEIPARP